jgi:hypothetical protein
VSLLPSMRAGHAGWCGLVRFTTAGRITSAGMGCGPPRAAGGNMIAGAATAGRSEGVQFAIVTARVHAVRFGERVVATRPDRTLPYGWRYAITLADTAAAATGLGQTLAAEPPALAPLDEDGRALPATTAADALGRGAATQHVTRTRPAPRCAIGAADGFAVSYARVALGHPALPARVEGPRSRPALKRCLACGAGAGR